MKTFIEQAQLYANYHQKPVTLYTHLVGVPLVLFSLMIFFGFLHLVIPGLMDFSLAFFLTIALWVYYLRLNWKLSLFLLPVLALLLWLSELISSGGPSQGAFATFVILFVIGWALLFAGHYLEGNKPAILDNLWHALIAPLYLTAEVCFMLGRMQSLKESLHGHTEVEKVEKSKKKK